MALIHWVGGSGSSFNTAANWSPATIPGSGDDALIGLAGAAVVSSVANQVSTLAVTGTATLTISAGTFTVTNGTGTGGLANNVTVGNGAVLSIGGTIVNSGTINESSTGTTTEIVLNQTSNILQGGGKVILSANTNNLILGAKATFELDNQNNQIIGAGDLGDSQMVLSNEGVIDADQSSAALTVDTGGNVILNSGTMEATAGGDLNILSPVDNAGGTIEAIGAGSVVFLQGNVTGGSVLASGGGVIQTSGTSGVLDGLGLHPVINGAPIQVVNGQILTLLGNITNNSVINLNSSGNNTELRIGSPIVTLSGSGSIVMTNKISNLIFGNNGAFELINQGNTISGAGQLGDGSLTFINNKGLVSATQSTALVLNTSNSTAVNAGTLQATNTGGLLIQSTAINNKGGTVQALVAGSHVDLSGSSIQGGILTTANGGIIQVVSGNATLDGQTEGTLSNLGTVVVNDQDQLTLIGTINNTGTISQAQTSTTGSTQLRIAGQTVTLQGGGHVVMSNNANNLIYGNSSLIQLVNVNNIIQGAGQLGDGGLTLINQAAGVINANQAASLSQAGALVVNTGSPILINTGLMEDTNTGGLELNSSTIKNAGGRILSTGTGSHVDINGSQIQGGTINSTAGGVVQIVGSGNSGSLDGTNDAGAVTNLGTFLVDNGASVTLYGTIINSGTILENQVSTSGSTNIRIGSQNVTLTGGGKLMMSDANANQIFGNNASFTLTNVNNTISGAGQIGAGQSMFLVNNSIINANQAPTSTANGELVLNTGGNIITNTATLEDTGAGGLEIVSAINNTGGTILSAGAGSHVDLAGGYIEGGLLTTSGGGVIQTVGGNGSLDGITSGVINNAGSLQITDNTTLSLIGTINNTGTINQDSLGSNTNVRIASNVVTLQGAGKWLLSNSTANQIFGNNNTFKLVNVDNTIAGGGQIGEGTSMFLVNQAKGVINANQAAALIVNTGGNVIANTGLMESTGTVALNGGLVLDNAVNNQGGTILAAGPLAHVDLTGGYIEGGLLNSTGGGAIQTISGNSGSLDGITSGVLTNNGTVLVNDDSTLTLVGSIVNNGTILQDAVSQSNNTDVRIGTAVTLSGTGKWILSDNANNRVFGNSAGNTLINNILIEGAGQFGTGGMEYVNKGTILGTGTNGLLINLGSGNGVNSGTIGATGAGGVIFQSGIFTNTGIMTVNDGSAITYQSGVINTNLNEGDLVGGTWRVLANGHGATMSLTGGPIVRDAGIIVLSGAGSVLQSGTGSGGTPYTPLEQTLTTVYTGGQLQILANRNYTTGLGLTDMSIIQLGGGTLQAGSIGVTSTGHLNGFGVVQDAVANSGQIAASGGKLDVIGAIAGTGSLTIGNAAILELGTTAAEIATFATGSGTLKFDVSKSFTGTIAGLALGDVIDLGDINNVTTTTISGSTLTVVRSAGGNLTYNVAGALTGNHFHLTSDGGTGTDLTLTAGATGNGTGGGGGGSSSSTIISDPSLIGSTIHWVGGSGNSFNTAANWNPAQVPASADDAEIDSVAVAAVTSSVANTVTALGVTKTNSLTITANTFAATSGSGVANLAGTINIDNGAELAIGGAIVNSGTINDLSTGTATDLVFTQTTNTLSGGGKINLSTNANNLVFASSSAFQLINQNNTISGSGNFGDGQMTLVNSGIIDANQAAVPLTVNTGASTITNSGTMEATNGATLNILNAVNNTGGTIEAIGAGSVVFLQSSVTGGSLFTSGGGQILTSGASSTLDGLGLHPVVNGAPIQVSNGNILTLLGSITNNSSINLNSTGNNTDLRISSAIVTLAGKGSINMTNNSANRIFSTNSSAFQLINQGNTIDGAGQLGSSSLTFSNAGVVNANQTSALALNTSGQLLTNTGTLQSSGTGGLSIQSTSIDNQGGTVEATAAGSHVDLSGSGIDGGTLTTANGGVIQTVSGNGTLDGITYGALTNNGTVKVNDLTILSLAGVINNAGTILENQVSTNGSTQIRIASQTVTLQGGGKLMMSNNGSNLIFGSSSLNTLVNVNDTISGAGQLGDASLTLINSGTINGNQTPTFTTSGLLVLNTSGNQATNTGTIESTGAGGLQIANTGITNTGGTIFASGVGHVDLSGGGIAGGTLNTTGGGVIQTVSGNGSLDGSTFGVLTNLGEVKVNDLTTLTLIGVINNVGTIFEDQISRNGSTQIRLASQSVTLQGGGQLLMSNNGANEIFGNSAANQLINVNNTIAGSGALGSGSMTFINNAAGTVNANQSVALVLNTSNNLVKNAGTLEDTGSGGLVIQGTGVTNTGTVLAAGASAAVVLAGGSSIQGGTLATSGGGVIETAVNDSGTLDGYTTTQVNNTGTVLVQDTSTLSLVGVINNTGTLMEGGFSNNTNTNIRIAGQTVTLQGGGQLLMSNDVNNQIIGNNSVFTFINVDNTISGAGQIGTGTSMFLINQTKGIIDATQAAPLIVNTGSDLLTNNGLMESTSTVPLNGGLVIQGTTVNNAGTTVGEVTTKGTILAAGAAAHVDLSGAYIEGGLLTTSGGGIIQTLTNNSATLDGITAGALTNAGTLVVNDTSTLSLVGTISNTGTILENAFSANSNTNIRIAGTTTLTGTGVLQMSDNPNNQIFGNNSNFTLYNGITIRGAGQLGGGSLELVNTGLIQGTGINALVINLGNGDGVNSGLIGGVGAGGVILSSGFFTNTGAETANDGSSLTYQSAAANTNLNEGDLVGGTWRAFAAGHGAILSMTGGPIVNDAATIVLSGAGSVIQAGSGSGATPYTPIEQTLTTVTSGGQLQVLANRGYTTALNLTDNGLIQLGGGTFLTNALSIGVGGKFLGFGSLQETALNGSFEAGNTGFSTDYTFVPSNGTVSTVPGEYGITTNPATGFTNGYLSFGDHTSGTGNMMLVDGSTSASNAFWRENISLAANTTYTLEYFATSADGGVLTAAQEPTIQMSENGAGFGAATLITTQGGSPWQQVSGQFTTGAAGVYTISLADLNTASVLNDFAVDDITLTSSVGAGVVINNGTMESQGGALTLSNSVIGTGTLQADAGSSLVLNGPANQAATVVNNATVNIGNSDSLDVTGSVNAASTGVFLLNNSSILEVAVDTGSKNSMSFVGTSGNPELIVDAAAQFGTNVGTTSYTGPLLENFGAGDEVLMKDLTFSASLTPNYTAATGLLQINNGSANIATLDFQNSTLGTGAFHLTNVGGHVLVTHS